MDLGIGWYLSPFVPIVSRGLLCLRFRREMNDLLSEEEQDREQHRTYILAMAGFSFSALLGMIVLEAAIRQGFQIAIYLLLISFLFYMASLNMQGYKSRRWHDQLATALMDVASLALVLTVLNILHTQAFSTAFAWGLTALAILVWASDHFFRMSIQCRYLAAKQEVCANAEDAKDQ